MYALLEQICYMLYDPCYMICEVIPIKRLPRRFTHFDYTIPQALAEEVKPGQLVRIPLKSSEIFGLVLSLREKRESDTSALKEIIDIVHDTPILSPAHLKQIMTLSAWYGVATGTLAKMMLLPLQKRKLKTIELQSLRHPEHSAAKSKDLDGLEKTSFQAYNSETQHKQLLQELINKSTPQQILILVPEVSHIEEVLSLLHEHSEQITTWHSGLSTKEQFERWLQIRNGDKRIIIGTRGSILLPFFDLGNIVIDYEHKSNHKHWDQAPRFHVKDIADLLRTAQGVDVTLMSYSLSVETYFNIHKKNYSVRHPERPEGVEGSRESDEISPLTFGLSLDDVRPQLVNLSDEHRGGNYDPISTKLEQALMDLQGSAFLHINRLGLATYIGCNDCGWRAVCPTCKLPQILHEKNKQLTCHYCKTTNSLPVTCPKCKAAIVRHGGIGTETVEKFMKEFVQKHNLPHEVVRIDSQTNQEIKQSNNQIIIGTDAALSYIDWEATSLIALLDVDKQLAIPEFRAQEDLWHSIQDIQYKKKVDAAFYIQTRDPQHLVLRSLSEPERFYRTDLNHRMALGYPPYKYLVRYFYGHADYREAETVMKTSVDVLNKRLAETTKNIQLSPAFDMHPRYYRGRHWFAVLAKLDTISWQEDLVWLNSHIPATWKMDPNPISVLSP